MEIIFNEFIFAYSLAEYHNKVATSIFYFARTVIHATAQTDRLCYIKSELPHPLFYSCRLEAVFAKNFFTVADWKRAFKKSAGTYGFWAGSERYTLRAISEANINFFACCFKASLTILV